MSKNHATAVSGNRRLPLNLIGTKVTDVGVAKLQPAFPNCRIRLWPLPPSGTNVAVHRRPVKHSNVKVEPNTDQARAVAEIEKLGGSVDLFARPTPMIVVDLVGSDITDAGLANLKRLPPFQMLSLKRTKITNAGLANLKDLNQLQRLELDGTEITGAGLENLKGLDQIEFLSLACTQVADNGLEHLKELPKLHNLSLMFTHVTDAGLEHLKGMGQLQLLDLRANNRITDQGVEKLQRALPRCKIYTSSEQ